MFLRFKCTSESAERWMEVGDGARYVSIQNKAR